MLFSVIKVEDSAVELEFFSARLIASKENFSLCPKETQLVAWRDGKFTADENATAERKRLLWEKAQRLAK